MTEPQYTVFIRVPIPRRGFVDPPPVSWDIAKDEALWKILSGHKEIDFPVDFLVQQVAYLNERHQSHFLAQVRKATAAAKGSAAQSPIPGSDGHTRTPSALSVRRDVSALRIEGAIAGFASNAPIRPAMSRNTSATTTVMRDGGGASPRVGNRPSLRAAEQAGRTRLSSLPMASPAPRSPEQPGAEPSGVNSPGPAETSSTTSSDDESIPAQSRIIRRPPRFQPQESYAGYQGGDEGDESEPAFRPYNAPSADTSSPDLASTVKLKDGRNGGRRTQKTFAKEANLSQTSDSSASSPAVASRSGKPRESRSAGQLSPRRTAELSGTRSSREGSEGTHSISSSYSDLDGKASPLAFGRRYFINDEDEIRSIANPDHYFKFFLNRNPRICARQRFEFNHAVESIVHQRLESQGLQKLLLPLGTPATEPHLPVFITPELGNKSRVVVIFGEPTQDLGLVARRVANGPGGINEGSMVSVVGAVKSQLSSPVDASPPGIVLANMGQTHWWPEGMRAVTVTASSAAPLPSLVHKGRRQVPALNDIPGSEGPTEHAKYVLGEVLGSLTAENALVDIIAIGESCEIVERVLDDGETWETWSKRLNSLVFLGPVYEAEGLKNEKLKDFMAKRARGYLVSPEPLGIPLAPPAGNLELNMAPLGFPCLSSSEPMYVETILIRARSHVLSYLQDVANDPGYENPIVTPADCPRPPMTEEHWQDMPEEDKPVMSKADPAVLGEQIMQLRRWKKFEETGAAPDTDSESGPDV
ncbi:hypothetical protein Trco_006979 [Trichoderma cornu-damae]|uniref:Autophagy-related protein 29 n=1 Tax=Trichoderma cornu-damae TaxID=654480 RepID=A0A9P8TUR8_9HYPO|nr:hypothetical protein Trco_006979 [Trichoderma cornu-damae]